MSIWQNAHPWLRDLQTYEPGKPIEDVARELGLQPGDIIKLASNENPLGPSPRALEAMRTTIEQAHIYPDGGGYALREAIAARFGLERANVILGCGSNEIIEFLGKAFLRPGTQIVTSRHAFAVYKLVATLCGARTVEIPDPDFLADLGGMADAVDAQTRLVFITDPNNPTGTRVTPEALEELISRVPPEVVVVLDEAYYEFLSDPPDTLRYLREGHENVVILRTFSKIQGLANLRIGYGLAHPNLIDILQKTRQPFNASGVAQAAALAALADDEHQERTRELTIEGRTWMQEKFSTLGFDFVPSHANFCLVNVGSGSAVFKALLRRGIIVRDMSSYGLPQYVRVSIGTMEQNRRFLTELERLMPDSEALGAWREARRREPVEIGG